MNRPYLSHRFAILLAIVIFSACSSERYADDSERYSTDYAYATADSAMASPARSAYGPGKISDIWFESYGENNAFYLKVMNTTDGKQYAVFKAGKETWQGYVVLANDSEDGKQYKGNLTYGTRRKPFEFNYETKLCGNSAEGNQHVVSIVFDSKNYKACSLLGGY